jgi:predicted enzyme related to lactoylglutathione lyase
MNALVLEVSDLAAAARFYGELVGLELHVGSDNGAPGDRWISGDHRAISWGGDAYLHFALYESKGERTRGAQVGFSCDDLAAAHGRLVDGGAKVVHPPRPEPWGDTARYEDPDGNVVALTQSRG